MTLIMLKKLRVLFAIAGFMVLVGMSLPACAGSTLAIPNALNATSISTAGFTANWTAVSGATSYTIQVSASTTFATILKTVTGATGTSNAVSVTLTANTSYYYRVQAKNGTASSDYSNVAMFATLATPTLANPAATSINATGFTANWNAVTGATCYLVDVATDSAFTTPVRRYYATTTPLAITLLSPSTTYYFRVTALLGLTIGNTSAVSSAVTTLAPTGVPAAPATPTATGVTNTSFTATWTAVSGATSYTLDVATTSGFGASIIHTYRYTNLTNQIVDNLSPKTTYYFRVRGVNAGGEGTNSATASVTTLPYPVGYVTGSGSGFKGDYYLFDGTNWGPWLMSRIDPAINFYCGIGSDIAPGIIPVNGHYAIRWTGQFIAPATGDYIFVVNSDDGARLYLNGVKYIDDWTAHATATDTTPSISLTSGQKVAVVLEFWENDQPPAACQLLFSGPGLGQQPTPGTQATDAPSDISISSTTVPNGAVGSLVGTLSTTGGESPYTYTLVNDGSGSAEDNAKFQIGLDANGQSALLTNVANLTSAFYSVCVQTTDVNGNSYTEILNLGAAPVATAASKVKTTSFQANWNSFTGADHFVLEIATDSLCNNVVQSFTPAGNATNQAVNISSNVDYYYRLYAVNASGGRSAYSNIITARTPTAAPSAPTLNAGTNITAFGFDVTWTAPTNGADSYTLQVATNSGFTTGLVTYTNLTDTAWSVGGLSPNTTYYYHVAGVNSVGTGTYSTSRNLLTLPDAPTATAATAITTTNLTANWTAPTGGATSYTLQVSTTSDFSANVTTASGLSGTSKSLSTIPMTLTPNTTYYYRVSAGNTTGYGQYSNTITAVTLPGAPTATAATAITATGGTANWTAPSGGAASYSLQYSTDSNIVNNVTTVAVPSGTSQAITGLSPNTTYYYQVAGVNATGTGAYSNHISFLTLPDVPTATAATAVTATGGTANWTAPAGGTASYSLQYSTDPNIVNNVTTVAVASGLSKAITGLSSNTTYYYQVAGVNATGTGAYSNKISFLTLPGAPTATAATGITAGDFTANWTAPTGGAASYNLQVSTTSDFSANVTTATGLSGTSKDVNTIPLTLTPNTTYYYRMIAVNATGSGSNSNTITVLTLPGAPTATAATAISTTGGTASYSLQYSTDPNIVNNVTTVAVASGLSKAITGLTPNTTYYYQVAGVNATGTGVYSNKISFITLPGVPTATAATAITATGGTANWTAHVNGAASYSLQYSTDPNIVNNVTTVAVASGLSKAITGLTPNTTYYYQVAGVNATGTGAYSNKISFLTTSGAPTATAATGITTTNFVANWQAPTGGATNYQLQVSTTSDFSANVTTASSLSGTSKDLSTIPMTLTPNTTYYYHVAAGNANGYGSYSNTITALTLPGVPTATAASAVTATGGTANWTAPAGGAASYSLQYSTDPSIMNNVTTVAVPSGLSKAITGLLPNTTYYYQVAGVNATGTGAYSNKISFLTTVGVPTATAATGITATNFIANWQAPAGGASSYSLQVSTDSNLVNGVTTVTVNGTTKDLSTIPMTLTPNTVYYYRVAAVNGSGTGTYSNIVTAITRPGLPMSLIATPTSATSLTASWQIPQGGAGLPVTYTL